MLVHCSVISACPTMKIKYLIALENLLKNIYETFFYCNQMHRNSKLEENILKKWIQKSIMLMSVSVDETLLPRLAN